MKEETIIGKMIHEIYETDPSFGEGFLESGRSHYFSIVIELKDETKFELGVHEIKEWNSKENLIRSEGTYWALENKLEYRNQIIKTIIHRDPNEDYDGSLTLILENNVILEHQSTNGDQLFISKVEI